MAVPWLCVREAREAASTQLPTVLVMELSSVVRVDLVVVIVAESVMWSGMWKGLDDLVGDGC